jgi:putative membrane protein
VTIFLAFLHHLAAFALVAALTVELVLLNGELTLKSARRLQMIDAVYGASAGLLLLVGLLRVFYFEKGAAYYFHSAPFIAKLSLFVAVGLLSIYPTVTFRGWTSALKRGQPPTVTADKPRTMRAVIHGQLAGVALILLCAAMMARGVGFFG